MIDTQSDKYGRVVQRGDCVIYKRPYYANLQIGLVESFTVGGNPRIYAWNVEKKQYIGKAFAVTSGWIKAEPLIQSI